MTPLGAREQLTFYREPVTVARVAAIGGGAGLRVPAATRAATRTRRFTTTTSTTRAVRMLTDGKGLNGGLAWSHDGTARRVPRHGARRRQLRPVHRRAGQQRRRRAWCTTASRRTGRCDDWSPDDTKLLIRNFVSANESHLFVLDIASAALTPVSEGSEPASVSQAQFTADGRGVYLITNRDSEFEQLRRVDLGDRRGRNAHRPHPLGHRTASHAATTAVISPGWRTSMASAG